MDRRSRNALLFALVALSVVNAVTLLGSMRDAVLHLDAWGMLNENASWGSFLHEQWQRIFASTEGRQRPVMRLVIVGYFRATHEPGVGLAYLLWGAAMALVALQARFLVLVGFRKDTALLAGFVLLWSRALTGTTFAHQYNDLVLAAVFSFAAMNLCLRDAPGPLWLVLPLLLLSLGSHESGLLCGPMLVLANALRCGPGAWRRWLVRRDTLAVLGSTVAYGIFRLLRGGNGGLVGVGALGHNLLTLGRNLFDEGSSGLRVLVWIASLVLLARSAAPREWWRAAVGVLWALGCYSLFLLNQNYQSVTYLCVAPLVPLALLLEPVAAWLGSFVAAPRRQALGYALLALCLFRGVSPRSLGAEGRDAGAVLRALLQHIDATRDEPVELWVYEDRSRLNYLQRTHFEEDFAVYFAHDCPALRLLRPGRRVALHVADSRELAANGAPPTALRLLLEGDHSQRRVWRVGPPLAQLFGPAASPRTPLGGTALQGALR